MSENKIVLSNDVVKDIISKNYKLGEIDTIEPLDSGHESDNTKFTTEKGNYVLKLYLYPNKEAIERRMKALNLLLEHNIKVPKPVKTSNERLYVEYKENNILVVMTFISGKPILRKNKQEMFQWMKWLGKQVGILHKKSKQITYEKYTKVMGIEEEYNPYIPPGEWPLEQYEKRHTNLPGHKKNELMISLFEQLIQDVEKFDFYNLTTGMNHGDLMPGVFYKEGEELTGILDFGYGYSYLIGELSRWTMYTELYKPEYVKNYKDFILEYLKYSEIPVEELKILPILLKSTSFVQYFYFSYRIHNNIIQGSENEDDPEGHNWNSLEESITFVEKVHNIDNNYFYDLALEVIKDV